MSALCHQFLSWFCGILWYLLMFFWSYWNGGLDFLQARYSVTQANTFYGFFGQSYLCCCLQYGIFLHRQFNNWHSFPKISILILRMIQIPFLRDFACSALLCGWDWCQLWPASCVFLLLYRLSSSGWQQLLVFEVD